MMERILMWVLIVSLSIGFAFHTYLLRQEKPVCVVDLFAITTDMARNVNASAFSPEEANRIMKSLKNYMSPDRFGCSYIFLKGALVSGRNVLDITSQVMEYARKIQSGTPGQ